MTSKKPKKKKIAITKKTSIEEMGGIVCQALADKGIEAILTGGAVVSIYTHNEYESYDLDFVTFADRKRVDEVMLSLGFAKEKKGRHYVHPKSSYFVEFPGYAPSIGKQPIREVAELRTSAGVLKLLTPTQAVMDRLAAYLHWDDAQASEQALMIIRSQPVDLDEVQKWAKAEGMEKKYLSWTDERLGS